MQQASLPIPTVASDEDSELQVDGVVASTTMTDQHSKQEEHQSCLTLLRNALQNPDQVTAMLSNYSTSYNAVNVGIVLPILEYSMSQEKHSKEGAPYSSPPYASLYSIFSPSPIARRRHLDDSNNNNNNEEEGEEDSIVASSLLAGMIFGQLIGGFLGDILGRRNAMMLVMILQIAGSLGSAIFVTTDNIGSIGNDNEVYNQLAIWRFILGIGAGGVYPLAAVMSAENKQEDGENVRLPTTTTAINEMDQEENAESNEENWNAEEEEEDHGEHSRNNNDGYATTTAATATGESSATDASINSFQRIALTFSTQGLGFLTVPLLAYPMLAMRWNVDLIWRILLGLGAVPGLAVLYMRICSGKIRKKQCYTATNTDGRKIEMMAHENGDSRHSNSIGNMDGEGATGPASSQAAALQDAVSTLFTSDIPSSDSSENEIALVDNSHLETGMKESNDGIQRETTDVDGGVVTMNQSQDQPRGLWESIQAEPNLGIKFAGTAGTWFLFDILFYGNTLFEPLVLEAAFGSHSPSADGYELLIGTVRDSLVISLLSLPGYFMTVLLIGRRTCSCRSLRSSASSTRCGSALCCFPCYQTPVYIQMQGFFIMFLLYIIIGLYWTSLSNMQWLLLILYAGTFFFANYGPNTTTFLLPSVTYSEECRSTLNGISAACGKAGALTGASLFAPAADLWGENVVMIFCGCVSLVAWTLTKICLGGKR